MKIRTARTRHKTRKELRLLHRRCPRFRTLVGNPNTPKGMFVEHQILTDVL